MARRRKETGPLYDTAISSINVRRKNMFLLLSVTLISIPIVGILVFLGMYASGLLETSILVFLLVLIALITFSVVGIALVGRLRLAYIRMKKGIQFFSSHMVVFGQIIPYKDVISLDLPGSVGSLTYRVDRAASSSISFKTVDLGEMSEVRPILEKKLKKRFVNGLV